MRTAPAPFLFATALLAACAEAPPPPAADGELVARAVALAQQRAEAPREAGSGRDLIALAR